MLLPGRDTFDPQYRFGFNGKENDLDFRGVGQITDYGARIYNARLGKFLSVDPLMRDYPWNSTYAYAENDVIRSIDLDGLEKFFINTDTKINPTTKLPEYYRHVFINPNKLQHDKGLLGHFDHDNKISIINDPNELSEFDRKVFDYALDAIQQKNISGASIKMTSSDDIKLKTVSRKDEASSVKPQIKVHKPIAEDAAFNSGIFMIPNGNPTGDRNSFAANQIIKPQVDRLIRSVLSKSKEINSINLSINITANSANSKNINEIKNQVQSLYPKAKIEINLDPNYKLSPDSKGHKPSAEDFGYRIKVSGIKK